MMKGRLLLLFACLAAVRLPAGERANTVLLHPGETIYARFERDGAKLRLLSSSAEKDANAQLVVILTKGSLESGMNLKLENGFPKDLDYQLEMRSTIIKRHQSLTTGPVVGGKVAYVEIPALVTELALYDFKLEK